MECISCFENITGEILYREKGGEWKKSSYCFECLNYFIEKQWKNYEESVKNETCKKSLKNLLNLGPPFYIREHIGLPCENGDVYEISINGEIKSAKLKNIFEGKELEEYLLFLNNLKIDT
jgi:hypothetical protein